MGGVVWGRNTCICITESLCYLWNYHDIFSRLYPIQNKTLKKKLTQTSQVEHLCVLNHPPCDRLLTDSFVSTRNRFFHQSVPTMCSKPWGPVQKLSLAGEWILSPTNISREQGRGVWGRSSNREWGNASKLCLLWLSEVNLIPFPNKGGFSNVPPDADSTASGKYWRADLPLCCLQFLVFGVFHVSVSQS